MYFEKKITAAELIFSHLSILSGAMLHSNILSHRLKEKDYFADEDEFEIMVDKNLNDNIDKQMKLAENSTSIISYSLGLYFDVPEPQKEKLKAFHNLLGQLGNKIKQMDQAKDYVDDVKNTNKYKDAQDTFLLSKTSYENHLKEISHAYDNMYEDLLVNTKIMRKEIKKYEID